MFERLVDRQQLSISLILFSLQLIVMWLTKHSFTGLNILSFGVNLIMWSVQLLFNSLFWLSNTSKFILILKPDNGFYAKPLLSLGWWKAYFSGQFTWHRKKRSNKGEVIITFFQLWRWRFVVWYCKKNWVNSKEKQMLNKRKV